MASLPFNLPLLSIPIYYVLSIVPHARAIFIANKGKMHAHDNRNPHSTQFKDNVKKRLTQREFAAYERAERCSSNGLENMPLFVGAVFAGLLAEQQVGVDGVGLNAFVVGWLILRTFYTVTYLLAETLEWSYLRTIFYYISSLWAFGVIGRASLALGK